MRPQFSRLDEAQGRNEQRTEMYSTYFEGAAEFLTKRFAKSDGKAGGLADGLAGATGGLR
jgi:hypothetical protein